MDNNYNNYNSYNPYTNSVNNGAGNNGYQGQPQQSQSNPTGAPKGKSPFAGFGVTITKCIAIALVFGLVAGVGFTAVTYFGGNALGVFADADANDTNKENGILHDKDDNTNQDISQNVTGTLTQTDTESNVSISVMDVSDIVESVMPCVVSITNTTEVIYQNMWGQNYSKESTSAGSGFIVDQDDNYIYIATNNHVVEDATELTVQFSDETIVQAEIKGTVASKDLAVIKVALKNISSETLAVIRIASLGNSNELEVGEAAIAIGNALGYGQSVTTGVISALGRSVTVSDSTTGSTIVCSNLIQTDAAINPGNSGGALLNTNGEVIGINSVKYSDTSVEGIGYAIPISDAMIIIEKLISGEKVETANTGYLGIQGSDTSDGVFVRKVFSGSAAEKAGICVGDIIVEFEGNQISTMSQLKELLSYYAAGEEVEFVIYHAQGNEYVEKQITVTLGDASSIK